MHLDFRYFILFLLVIFTGRCVGQEVSLSDIAEICSANFITQDYDHTWEDAVDGDWKIRMASKLHVYTLAHNMYRTNQFRDFDESHFKQACLHTDRVRGWEITNTTGYGGRRFIVRMAPTAVPRVYRFEFPHGPLGPIAGTASVILSDMEKFTAFEFCMDNGLRTFAVFSKDPITAEKKAIKLHLKSIGFNPDHMVDLAPNNHCTEEKPGVLKPKDDKDLPEPATRVYAVGAGGEPYPNLRSQRAPVFYLPRN